MEKWQTPRIDKMLQKIYLNKLKKISEPVRQFGGLIILIIIVIFSFAILNNIFGEGEELIAKMKKKKKELQRQESKMN